MLSTLFKPRPAKATGAALYSAVAAQSRAPVFYQALGVPDRIDARFELYSLHLAILLERLAGQGEQAEEVAQEAFDAYVRSLDDVLRDVGIGDLSMAKKMKQVAALVLGRLKGVRDALAPPDVAVLEALLGRTVYAEADSAEPARLAAYVVAAHEALAAQPLAELLAGKPAWPQP
ncbi:MAG: ubiquinol-cytochrome C reductase [Caulobacteraceae bacterium]|nr:ubiquinol-cytochrome C reductase [Caulobacteraceae bacterium]